MKKVRIQLFAMQICSLLLILAISSFFFDRTLMLTEERQNYYLQSSLSQAAQGVESVLNEIQLSTENYAYSAAVQELLPCQNVCQVGAAPCCTPIIWQKTAPIPF